MAINIKASDVRGGNPVYDQTITVEQDKHGVYVEVPRADGVISKESAAAFAAALNNAAGVAPVMAATGGIPTGSILRPNGDGFILTDPKGVVIATFGVQSQYVSQ